jgi:hypothetical protein
MSLYVLDTDIPTLYYRGDPVVLQRVDAHPANDLAISMITVATTQCDPSHRPA